MTDTHPVIGAAERAWKTVVAWVTRTGHRVYAFLHSAVARVGDRWGSDSSFRRTLTTAITAITVTAIPSAAFAAAVGALLTERPTRPSFNRFDDYDDEPDDSYPSSWPTRPRKLWDSLI